MLTVNMDVNYEKVNEEFGQCILAMQAMCPWPNLIYLKVWGSHSHNCALPESDMDMLGVFVAPMRAAVKVGGLSQGQQTINRHKPDVQLYEADKFCQMLLKGNPQVIEALWTERMYYRTRLWDMLTVERDLLTFNKTVLRQYLGYATAQYHRLLEDKPLHTTGGQYNTKWAYHCLRLLGDAGRIARREPPQIWKIGEERDLLMAVRRGEYDRETVAGMMKAAINKAGRADDTDLMEHADRRLLDHWLYLARESVT